MKQIEKEIERENRMTRMEQGLDTAVKGIGELKELVKENHEQTQQLFSSFDITYRQNLKEKADKCDLDELKTKMSSNESKIYNLVLKGFFEAIAVIVALAIAITK